MSESSKLTSSYKNQSDQNHLSPDENQLVEYFRFGSAVGYNSGKKKNRKISHKKPHVLAQSQTIDAPKIISNIMNNPNGMVVQQPQRHSQPPVLSPKKLKTFQTQQDSEEENTAAKEIATLMTIMKGQQRKLAQKTRASRGLQQPHSHQHFSQQNVPLNVFESQPATKNVGSFLNIANGQQLTIDQLQSDDHHHHLQQQQDLIRPEKRTNAQSQLMKLLENGAPQQTTAKTSKSNKAKGGSSVNKLMKSSSNSAQNLMALMMLEKQQNNSSSAKQLALVPQMMQTHHNLQSPQTYIAKANYQKMKSVSPVRRQQFISGENITNKPLYQKQQRQASAPKLRNTREKRQANHQYQQQHQSAGNTVVVSRTSVRAKSYQHNFDKRPGLAEFNNGRPPLLQQSPPQIQNLVANATQTRAIRGRNKNNSQQLPIMTSYDQSGVHGGSPKNYQYMMVNEKHQHSANNPVATKSLASIALGLRQNQCQTALLQHMNASQGAGIHYQSSQQAFVKTTPNTKSIPKDHHLAVQRANKTTSTRHSKRDLINVAVNENTQNALGNTLTQSISKMNSFQHLQTSKNGTKNVSSKRNELANYLSKILNQQQRMNLNSYDNNKNANAQPQVLYHQDGASAKNAKISKISSSKGVSSSSKQQQILMAQNTGVQGISTQSQSNLPKSKKAVILLSEQQIQKKKQSQPNSNSKRGKHQQQQQQLQSSITSGGEIQQNERKFKQALVRFSNGGGGATTSSQRNSLNTGGSHQYLATTSQISKKQGHRRSQHQSSSGLTSHIVSNTNNTVAVTGANNIASSPAAAVLAFMSKPSNSLLLMKQHQMQQQQSDPRKVAKKYSIRSNNTQQLQPQSQQNLDFLNNQNFILANKIKKAIENRKDELDHLEQYSVDKSRGYSNSYRPTSQVTNNQKYRQSNSERTLKQHTLHENKNQPQRESADDHHTIVNIRAHDPIYDYNTKGSGKQRDGGNDMTEQERSINRVEYHSDNDAGKISGVPSVRESQTRNNIQQLQNAISLASIGCQTSILPTQIMVDKEVQEVSNREDKNDKIETTSVVIAEESITKILNQAEIAIWAHEKIAIQNYSAFYVEQYEPFIKNILVQISRQPKQSLSSVAQQLDIFGVRHEQQFSIDERKDSISADLFYKFVSNQLLSLQKLSQVTSEQIIEIEEVAQTEIMDKDAQIAEMKEQVRKLQKELFIRSEKLHLSEQMNKLKDKEVVTLRNKIPAMVEQADRAFKEHQKALVKKDEDQKRNFLKATRELKTLYEQNKDLFEHNKALRDDLLDQDEKVRKLINVIQRHTSVMHDIEHELDQTETKIHDQSQISNAIPWGANRQKDDRVLSSKQPRGQTKSPQHGVVFVGQNKIPIPKFDPLVIEKYNRLNIEGKLPHIVETNKFDPLAVKEQVKDIFREIKQHNIQQQQHEFEEQKTPATVQRVHHSSGIGNQTPFTLDKHSQEESEEIDRQKHLMMYQESSNDMSGGKRKDNILTKLLNVNSPHYLNDHNNHLNDNNMNSMGYGMIQANHVLQKNRDNILRSAAAQQNKNKGIILADGGSPQNNLLLSSLSQALAVQTPPQHARKSSGSIKGLQGPKKDNLNAGYITNKKHKVENIVTLQNQLYHQLIAQNNQATYGGTPNNHQSQEQLLTPVQAMSPQTPQSSIQTRFNAQSLCLSQPQQQIQSIMGQQMLFQDMNSGNFGPQYQSIDQPDIQTPSMTATLPLELTDGIQQQILLQNLNDVGASTAVFNQILISDPLSYEDHQIAATSSQPLANQPYQSQNNRQQFYQNLQGMGGSMMPSSFQDQQQQLPDQSEHQIALLLQRAMYEEEKEGLTPSTSQVQGDNTTNNHQNQTAGKSSGLNLPQGGTLQDQISKQYSPILRKHDSLEQMNDFSPSLMNERNELSNNMAKKYVASRQHGLAPLKVIGLASINDDGEDDQPGAYVLTSIDQEEKSVSLLESSAVKEEDDSTQKKYIP